ncbi:vWA domain-containing protein [Methylotenera sp. G11]|uniref:vWA domain-containing protein n=1 Tax=Methylotenera sp. G11 TaxID=1506585 RepID=UPI0006478B9C|nr:vWA domain-containing protein [Methylotenera sp. G11]
MNQYISILKSHYESLLLIAVALLLLLAIYKPQIQLKQDVHNYLLIADVSQSMNAQDLKLNNQAVSRMDYTKHLMKRVVETSSCGTYISLGVFAAENVGLLLMPLEVCANYDVITDSIDHLEWRMAWRGNSRLSFGIKSAESMFDYLNIPATMLFFTDGDEAPKVNAINKLDLSSVQIGKNLLFVGVGGHQPVPVPRYNSSNKWVGYWSSDTKENSAGAVGDTYSDTSKDEPDPIVAYAEFDRYLSQLDSDYLKQVSAEIKGGYIEGQDSPEFYSYIQSQKPSASFVTAYSLTWLYLTLAILMVLLIYLPDMRSLKILSQFKYGRK